MGKRLSTFVMDSLDGRVHGSEGENKAVREGEVGGGEGVGNGRTETEGGGE